MRWWYLCSTRLAIALGRRTCPHHPSVAHCTATPDPGTASTSVDYGLGPGLSSWDDPRAGTGIRKLHVPVQPARVPGGGSEHHVGATGRGRHTPAESRKDAGGCQVD